MEDRSPARIKKHHGILMAAVFALLVLVAEPAAANNYMFRDANGVIYFTNHAGNMIAIRNNAVIVCAGGVLPTPFLKEIGVMVETKYGTA